MLTSDPWVDVGVFFVLMGPLFMRWPALLLLSLGAVAASFVSPEWANTFHQAVVPAIFVTLFGYVVAIFAKTVGAFD